MTEAVAGETGRGFEALEFRTESLAEFEAAVRAAVATVFPPGRPDEGPFYTVRPSRCQFRNGADVIADEEGELLRDESGNYAYSTPLYKWICTLGGSRAYAEKGSADERFETVDALLTAAMVLVKKTPDWQLWDKCGDGYSEEFTRAQGTVVKGYRLSSSCDRHGVVLLHLSLCHVRKAV